MGVGPPADVARLYKIGRVFREMGTFDLEALSKKADFGGITGGSNDISCFETRTMEEPNV